MPRNRVIYQSEALYVGPSPATSGHFTTRTQVSQTADPDSDNLIKQLHRIQTCNYGFNVERTDVNQFGELAAIDRVILSSPTVSMDFSYLLSNLENERRLGFTVDGSSTCIKNLIDKTQDEKNYFIKTVGEGKDAFNEPSANEAAVIGVGNGFVTSYTTECSVGNFPTVSINIEGLNMAFSAGVSGTTPAISPQSGTRLSFGYLLPKTTGSWETGVLATSTLRPGDLVFHFKKVDNEGRSSSDLTVGAENSYDAPGAKLGDNFAGGTANSDPFAKIQSYNISLDLGREPIQKLGSRFAFTREVTFPITVNCTIEALVADLTTGSLSDIVNCDDSYDITINLLRPSNCASEGATAYKDIFVQYRLKNCKVNSQSFSSDIGSNKSVSLEFSAQIGGPNQTNMGLFMSGIHEGNSTSFAPDSSAAQ